MSQYPKRLIEVDLPIKRISAHARREKGIRHGHISTLHIWWARRPLAACRAVICASLWPDPVDPLCPDSFRYTARSQMSNWAKKQRHLMGPETLSRVTANSHDDSYLEDNVGLRTALLDFIADFANWDNSTKQEYLTTSRTLTQAAHEALGGVPGTRPLVVDPFAGGGAIPLEALRVGADAFASDLNPVAVLLNKMVLEYIPKYGSKLISEVRKWGDWVKEQAEKELADYYPKDIDGAIPIAYIWARTIRCEGPSCGAEVPLMRSLWLAKKSNHSVALGMIPNTKETRVDFEIIEDAKPRDVREGTARKGSATCPVCGYTTPVASVREQLKLRHGGANDARLIAVVCTHSWQQGRFYRLATDRDLTAIKKAERQLQVIERSGNSQLSAVPDEATTQYHSFVNRGPIYGLTTWKDYFLPRQALTLSVFSKLVRSLPDKLEGQLEHSMALAVQTSLALCVDKTADLANACCRWEPIAQCPRQLFARQAIPMVWDMAEGVPTGQSSGSFGIMVDRFVHVLEETGSDWGIGQVQLSSATTHPLPNDAAQAVITDPPYYYSVQYADLSDFFYVWLRRMLVESYPQLFSTSLVPKADEIIVQSPGHQYAAEGKNNAFYESRMRLAMEEGRRIAEPSGVGIVVFAHTSTAGWEAQLQAMLSAGWVITGSWPIDTEMATRVIAQGRSVLASSIHLVCRPRENEDGSLRTGEVGDWRDVLAELPKRIHDWMPRLADEGVVGADAIFACLGPALEIFSRYSLVEKASGEHVTLKEYLEHVWAAVSREALNMIFKDADATGFEEDARLTAMWLWTLSTTAEDGAGGSEEDEAEDEEEGGSRSNRSSLQGGYVLEYDAARKIAQGLGAHLERLESMVEVKGDKARLLPVTARTRYLFGQDDGPAFDSGSRKKKPLQTNMFAMVEGTEAVGETTSWGEMELFNPGSTTLDRVHQSMLLFAAGKGAALKRFLVDDGIGSDGRFWRLAQAFSALYPPSSDEKRWVDGVLARKKGLGF